MAVQGLPLNIVPVLRSLVDLSQRDGLRTLDGHRLREEFPRCDRYSPVQFNRFQPQVVGRRCQHHGKFPVEERGAVDRGGIEYPRKAQGYVEMARGRWGRGFPPCRVGIETAWVNDCRDVAAHGSGIFPAKVQESGNCVFPVLAVVVNGDDGGSRAVGEGPPVLVVATEVEGEEDYFQTVRDEAQDRFGNFRQSSGEFFFGEYKDDPV